MIEMLATAPLTNLVKPVRPLPLDSRRLLTPLNPNPKGMLDARIYSWKTQPRP